MMEEFVPAEARQAAEEYTDALRHSDIDKIMGALSPEVERANVREKLEEMTDLFPKEEPNEIAVVGFSSFRSRSEESHRLNFQYKYTDKYILVEITLKKKGEKYAILGFHVNALDDSLQHINAFSFENATAVHYFFLLACIGVPAFSIFVLVKCIRDKSIKKKWLWIIFILLGFGRLQLNWTTGQVAVNPLAVQLLGASATSWGMYAPWILSVSVPLGAIAFLAKKYGIIRDRKTIEEGKEQEESEQRRNLQ